MINDAEANTGCMVVGLVVLLVLIVIFGPWLTIWSLNTLFPVLAIPFTWKTWLATLLLFGGLGGLRNYKPNKS